MQKQRKTAESQFSVWSMIAYNYKGPLVFYNYLKQVEKKQKNQKVVQKIKKFGGAMNQRRYYSDILPIVEARKKEVEAEKRDFIFQEDNDGSHGTRSAENIARFRKDKMNLDYIDNWPPNSPDMNPIETVWRILKSRVKLHKSLDFKQLRRAIQEEWDHITIEEINEAILGSKKHPNRHMHARFEQVVERRGFATEN